MNPATTTIDRLGALTERGVAIWLDDLHRGALTSGRLADLVRTAHVTGVTTNPTIVERAIRLDGHSYRWQLADAARRAIDPVQARWEVMTEDIRRAADLLRSTYDATGGREGWVSIEVDPTLADDPHATLDQARRLWAAVGRRNVLIKIPATDRGLAAIAECLAGGISVNITLIFGTTRYQQVLQSYLAGMERAARAGRDLSRINSVASLFVSHIDTAVDQQLDTIANPAAAALRGRAAIAVAHRAYRIYEQAQHDPRWQKSAAAGARPQRLLWASTGTKDPRYDDVRYIRELVAPDTITTMPETTLRAFADHGTPGTDIRTGYADADAVTAAINDVGIDLDAVARTLEQEGLSAFAHSWQALRDVIAAELGQRPTRRHRPRPLGQPQSRAWSSLQRARLTRNRDRRQ
jgi:transaldolase